MIEFKLKDVALEALELLGEERFINGLYAELAKTPSFVKDEEGLWFLYPEGGMRNLGTPTLEELLMIVVLTSSSYARGLKDMADQVKASIDKIQRG